MVGHAFGPERSRRIWVACGGPSGGACRPVEATRQQQGKGCAIGVVDLEVPDLLFG